MPVDEPNWDNICISICEVRFYALRGMTQALSAAIPANVKERTKQWKLSKRTGKVERAFAGIVLCPEEISEWKQRSYSRRPTVPLLLPVSQCHEETESSPLQSFLICISLLYTFFLLISAPSLCSKARQKEEKHFARADISLYVHLTYKNFNSENNSCRLLNTTSDSNVTIVFSSVITNLKGSKTRL